MRRTVWIATIMLLAAVANAQQEVVPGVQLIRGAFVPGQQPDGNSVLLRAPEGLIVVDTGRHPEHTQRILDAAKEAKLPIAAIVNTHWHLDHIGGNTLVRAAYPNVRVYASDALQGATVGFLANYRKQLVELIANSKDANEQATFRAELAIIDAAPRLAPDVVVTATGTRTIAGRELQVGLERNSVTAGDVWLFDRKTGVVVAGDLVTFPGPFLDTACATHWQQSLDAIAKLPFDLLIPGHGAPLTHKQFDVYRTAFTNLLTCTASDREAAACIEGWMSDAATLMPDANVKFTRGLMGYYVDLLRKNGAAPANLCGAAK